MAVRRRHATGYTLIELMAVLAIASALLVIAIPMFRTQVQNSQMSAAATDLLSTFMSAKAEAVGRNYPVKVCIRNANADGCATTGQWEDGWLTFVDVNDNKALNAGEDILQIHPPLADTITARATATGDGTLGNSVTYRPNGLTDLTATRKLIICNSLEKHGVAARVMIVSMLGKASILKDEDAGDDRCPSE